MENKKTINNDKKISIWQTIKNEIRTVWNAKKKWIMLIYLPLATLLTIAEFSEGWKSINDPLKFFWSLIFLFVIIFTVFYMPLAIKENEKQMKNTDEIIKKAKTNSPKKYCEVKLMTRIIQPFLWLGLIAFTWLFWTIPKANWVQKVPLWLLACSFIVMLTLLCTALILYCREIGQSKEEEPKIGAEPSLN